MHTQTECVPDEPGKTHHFGHNLQNFENPICLAGYFDSAATSCLQEGVFLFMYIPANANIV